MPAKKFLNEPLTQQEYSTFQWAWQKREEIDKRIRELKAEREHYTFIIEKIRNRK